MNYKPKSPEDLKDVFERSSRSYTMSVTASYQERMMCLSDRRFAWIPGASWEGDFGAYFENKPKMEYNILPNVLNRIITQYKANRISVKFTNSNPDVLSSDKTNSALSNILRADEQRSNAEEAYDTAFTEGISGGMGAWRLRNDYEDPMADEQVVWIDPIRDADSCVFWDANATRTDKSDAKCCWVLVPYSKEAIEDEYGVDSKSQKTMAPSTWAQPVQQRIFDTNYATPIYLAEYYEVETIKVTQFHYESPLGDAWLDKTDTENAELLLAQGYEKTHTRRREKRRVHKYIMSGSDVLEDCGYIAGPNIPIIPFYANHSVIDGIERINGHVRYAKNSIRMNNMMISKMLEISSLSSVSKPIMAPEWVKGHEQTWAEDNVSNLSYVTLNTVNGPNGPAVPTIQYTQPYSIPPAMEGLLQYSNNMMTELLGRQDSQEAIQSRTNQSGLAIELQQNYADAQSTIYLKSFERAMQRSGVVWMGMVQEILVEDDRTVEGLSEDGNNVFHTINEPDLDDNGNMTTNLDLSGSKFRVSVTTGPASASRRQTLIRNLTAVLPTVNDPSMHQLLVTQILYNMEDAEMEEIKPFLRNKLIEMGAIEPTDEEAAKQTQKRPDPLAEAQTASLQAQTRLQDASAILKFAQTNTEEAKAAQILSTVDGDQISKVIQLTQLLATMTVNDQQAALQALQQQVQQPTQQQSMQQQPAASPISTPTGKIPSNPLEGVGISPKPTI